MMGALLDTIYAWICVRKGNEAAVEFLGLAREVLGFLAQNPDAGRHPKWAVRHKALRFWVISKTNFLIYYFHDELGVSIERVLDGRRDVTRIMERGLEETESGRE